MQELELLQSKYEIAKESLNKYKVFKLAKKREKVYGAMTESDIKNSQQDILKESVSFLQLVNQALLSAQKTSDFCDLLSLVDVVKVDKEQLDEKIRNTLIKEKKILLQTLLKTLKQHPHKAGVRIKVVRDSIQTK